MSYKMPHISEWERTEKENNEREKEKEEVKEGPIKPGKWGGRKSNR